MSGELLISGQLYGRITGFASRRDLLFYLEVSSTHLHIFEGHEDLSAARKHLRSLEINSTDVVERERRLFRFTLKRKGDGNYTFTCKDEQNRERWIAALDRLVNKKQFECLPGYKSPTSEGIAPSNFRQEVPKKVDIPKVPKVAKGPPKYSVLEQPLPPVPPASDNSGSDSGSGSGTFTSNRISKASVDSGFGPSGSGQVSIQPRHFSGEETHQRPHIQVKQTSTSDGGKFSSRDELVNHKWFWGPMSRPDAEKKMRAEGKLGNFAIRINTSGCYVMTFWRSDAIHHHKIIEQCGFFRFERTAVSAEGQDLVDLLDNYMKKCTDRKILPFGGVLHLVYDEPWNPPDVDMCDLMERYKTKKTIEERQKVLISAITKTSPDNPRKKGDNRRKDEYTIVSPTAEPADSELKQSAPSFSVENPKTSLHPKQARNPSEPTVDPNDKRNKPLPPTPDSISTPKQPSPRQSPNTKKTPIPLPQKALGTPTTATKPIPPPKVPSELDTPESVYENTSFGGRGDFIKKKSPISESKSSFGGQEDFIKKKLPIPEPKSSPVHTTQEAYENTGFGDSGGEAMYANVARLSSKPKPAVAARKKRAANGKEENGHIQVNNESKWSSSASYQNVGHSDKNSSQTYYQNITHPRRTAT